MNEQEITTLKALMEYEAARKAPPPLFPSLPDLPGGRYVDPEFFELEMAPLAEIWLFAAHMDEIPDPGSFILWENVGQPVVIVHSETGAVNAFYNTCSHRGSSRY